MLRTERQKVPALKGAIEDLKAGRLQAGWEKLEHYGVIEEVTDSVELRERAVEQHLEALRAGKTSLMISPSQHAGIGSVSIKFRADFS